MKNLFRFIFAISIFKVIYGTSYYHEQKQSLANGATSTVRAMAFKAWKNVGPLGDATNIIKTITNLATVVSSPTICGKHCLKTPTCCGFYYKHNDFCKLVNSSRRNVTSVVATGINYYEIVSQCTKNKSICGGHECIPYFHNNSYTCVYPEPIEQSIAAYINGIVWYYKGSGRCLTDETKTHIIYYGGNGYKKGTGILFQNINIEKGQTIKSATITFKAANSPQPFQYNVKIRGMKKPHATVEDVNDNTCTFRNSLTNNLALWETPNYDTVMENEYVVVSTDFKEVIQEIVNLNGWVAGNGLLIVLDNDELPSQYNDAANNQWYYVTYFNSFILNIRS